MVENVDEIVRMLTPNEADFLGRVIDKRPLGLADRVEDRARQKLRRMGLVEVAKNPRRWVPRPLGLAVRARLNSLEGEGGGD